MAGNIGIKQANGNFYAILEENSDVKKRLVLTTVHDNQKSVQIDLYKSLAGSMADAVYIGSIVVENITLKPKGEPSIEMTIHSTHEGSISAYAVDLANPENEHHLSVSLKSLEEDKNEYPDFEVNETRESRRSGGIREEKKSPAPAIIIAGLVLALLCFALWFFLFRNKSDAGRNQTAIIGRAERQTSIVVKENPPAREAAPAAVPPAAPVQTETPKPVVVETPPKANPQAGARERPPSSVNAANAPRTIPPEGITYTIKWGDTLWDISEAFYRNPRLYTFIARSNKIRNPNHIVSGTPIKILPRK